MLSEFCISINKTAIKILAITALIFVSGCADFFALKPIELQTKVILDELREIVENPNVKNPLPEIYQMPPQRINVNDGVKLFYFTKNHIVDKISKLITQQLGNKVSSNSSTNQLIIHCANDQDADTVLSFLSLVDVPPIQVHVDCLILERFADVTMDWETSIEIDNLLGEKITLGGKPGPEFPGASLRESKRADFGLPFGYWNQKLEPHEFRATVDVLISRGYLKILMNPNIVTVNGQKGVIKLRDNVPLEKILVKEGFDEPFSLTDYQWVEDVLEVTPHVFADGSVSLKTHIQLASKSKPEGVVQTSIITERSIDINENRIEPGKSLIIGGIRKSEERAVIRGVPFLKDIPIIGILFSSKDFEEKSTEVIFILTPSISLGGIDYTEMLEDVRQKRAKPKYERTFGSFLTDPFGDGVYTDLIEKQASQARFDQFKADLEKTQALAEVSEMKEKLLKTAEQVILEREKAEHAIAEAKKVKAQAEIAKTQAKNAQAQAEKAKEEAEKAKAAAEAVNRKL